MMLRASGQRFGVDLTVGSPPGDVCGLMLDYVFERCVSNVGLDKIDKNLDLHIPDTGPEKLPRIQVSG